jgi:hypothetical protein
MKEIISVLVNSKDREPDSVSTSNFRIKLPTPLNSVVNCDLRQLIISEGIFNVSEAQSEFIISVTLDGVHNTNPSFTTESYIPVGYYTVSQFAASIETAIQELFVNNNWGNSVRWITTSDNSNKQLELYSYDSNIHFELSFPRVTAAKAFGFSATTGLASTVTVDDTGFHYEWIQSPSPIGIEMLEYLCLQSAELGSRLSTSKGLPAFDVIPIPDRIRPLVYTRYESAIKPDFAPKSITELNLKLIQPSGKIVDLRSNDVAFLIEFVVEK